MSQPCVRRWVGPVVVVTAGFVAAASAQSVTDFKFQREKMTREEVAGAGVKNERVLDSIRSTPRHEFVNFRDRGLAYYDMALPIGEGQTISPPFIVAYMTEQLDPQPTDRVLEIGTGSGYQAAVLSPLVKTCTRSRSSTRWAGRPRARCNACATRTYTRRSATASRAGCWPGPGPRRTFPGPGRTSGPPIGCLGPAPRGILARHSPA